MQQWDPFTHTIATPLQSLLWPLHLDLPHPVLWFRPVKTVCLIFNNINFYPKLFCIHVYMYMYRRLFVIFMLTSSLPTVPSGSPQAFNVSVTSPSSAELTWQPPPFDQQNGVILSYVINATIVETGDSFLLFSNSTTLTVTNLKPFRTYICIIAAQTSVGTGPYGDQFILYTPEDGEEIISFCRLAKHKQVANHLLKYA